MSGNFRVVLDDEEMQRYLDSLDEKGVVKILRSASTRAGTVLRNAMRPEVPVKKRASGGTHGAYTARGTLKDYGAPGGMRASVRAARIRKTGAIGVVVGPMGKRAFMRHWVASGTKRHLIPGKGMFGFLSLVNHPGAKPNDYAGRASGSMDAAHDKAEAFLLREATK